MDDSIPGASSWALLIDGVITCAKLISSRCPYVNTLDKESIGAAGALSNVLKYIDDAASAVDTDKFTDSFVLIIDANSLLSALRSGNVALNSQLKGRAKELKSQRFISSFICVDRDRKEDLEVLVKDRTSRG